MRSSLSTEFDPILKNPGSRETSVLYLRVTGGLEGLPVRLRIAHSLTASSNSGPPRWLRGPLWSCRPTPSSDLRLSPLSGGFVGLPPVRSGGSSIESRNRHGRTRAGGVGSMPGGWLFDSAGRRFPRGDCTLVVFPVRVASTVPPCSGSVVLPSIARCFLSLWFLRGLCRESD